MDDKVIELESYKLALENKRKIDEGIITSDDLSLEEIEDVNELYKKQINNILKEIQVLEENNKKLKMLLKNSE